MAFPRPPAIALLFAATCVAALGCDTQRTTSIASEVRVAPGRLDFGPVEVGQSVTLPLRIENLSRGPVSLHLAGIPDGFTASDSQVVPGGSTLPVEISFAPSREGPTHGTLRLLVDGSEQQVLVTGSGALPQCRTLPEGAACAAPCVTDAHCASGLCVGAPKSCDDGDACTVDACGPAGCQSTPRSCAAPSSPCRVARCDPALGCVEEDAPDGTSCGADSGCGVRDVCLSGDCVARPAPDGAACRTDRCRPEGICQSGACLQPPGTAFAPRFVWPTIGSVSSMVLDEQDNLYVGETKSEAHPGQLVSLTRDGQLRWSRDTKVEALLWTGDRLIVGSGRDVALQNAAALLALDRGGVLLWSISRDDLSTATYAATVAPRFVSLALDELGRLVVLTAGYDGRGPWSTLSVVDPSTGAILDRHRSLPRNGFGLALDGTGNLLWSSRPGDYSYTEPGVLHGASATQPWPDTWSRNTSRGPPVVQGALPGLAFASWTDTCFSGPSTRWLDASTGASLTDTSVTFTGGLVANASTVWMLGTEALRSNATCVEPEHWRAGSQALFVFDRATGSRRAMPVPVKATAASTLMLTASDSALWVSAPLDPEEPGEILEVDSSGAIASQCELYIGAPREALLGDGRFFVVSGGAKFADRVVGVDAPGLKPAPSGWSSHLGNRFGHRRPD